MRPRSCRVLVALLLLVAGGSGCATIVSKAEMRQLGQPFSGVQLDVGLAECLWEATLSPETRPEILGNVAYAFTLIGPVADMPFSILADAVFYPLDWGLGDKRVEITPLSVPAVLPICGTGRVDPATRAIASPPGAP